MMQLKNISTGPASLIACQYRERNSTVKLMLCPLNCGVLRLNLIQSLADVSDDVIDMFDANRNSHQIRTYSGFL